MNSPLQITLRDVPRSPELEDSIRDQAMKLERFFSDVSTCRVNVGTKQQAKHAQPVLDVRVELHVPGQAIVTFGEDEDARKAVREAFGRAAHQLQQYAQRLRGDVKHHQSAA